MRKSFKARHKSVYKNNMSKMSAVACAIMLLASTSAAAATKHAALVLDANTGKVLHSAHADAKRYPASLTKMMTLYVVFDMIKAKRLSLDSKLLITRRAAAQQPSKLGVKAGTRIPMRSAIRALVTKSANDVAVAVAENLAGTEAKFAKYMTWRARQIGMLNTTFKNASGLTAKGQLSTARDMATLGLRLSQDHPKLFKFFKTKYFRHGGKRYKNYNSLLFNYAGTEGIKTGYTRASGFNLVTSVRKGKRHVIAVVMGGKTAKKRDATMRALLRANVRRGSTRKKFRKVPKPQLVAQAQPTRKARKIRKRSARGLSKKNPVKTIAANSSPVPLPQIASAPRGISGPYHVQVGSHTSETSAHRQLRDIMKRAANIVGDYSPVTMTFDRNEQRWYRARFSGFSKTDARTACADLKSRKIDCIVMAAQ